MRAGTRGHHRGQKDVRNLSLHSRAGGAGTSSIGRSGRVRSVAGNYGARGDYGGRRRTGNIVQVKSSVGGGSRHRLRPKSAGGSWNSRGRFSSGLTVAHHTDYDGRHARGTVAWPEAACGWTTRPPPSGSQREEVERQQGIGPLSRMMCTARILDTSNVRLPAGTCVLFRSSLLVDGRRPRRHFGRCGR